MLPERNGLRNKYIFQMIAVLWSGEDSMTNIIPCDHLFLAADITVIESYQPATRFSYLEKL